MAQATANPFDSLDDMTETLAETDDLLSQMAGKEVDRLLADSQGESAPSAPPVGEVAPPPEVAEQSMSAQLDELFTELQSPAAPASTPAPQPAADSKIEPLTQGLERAALLEAAGFDCATATTASPEGDSQDPISEAAPHGQERSALLEAAGFQATDGSALALDEPPIMMNLEALNLPSNIQLAPLPAYLKPLEWLSAPLDKCPAKVRQILGPVAIITMINALAVLTYVLVIRKH
jgi:hypothetical protein